MAGQKIEDLNIRPASIEENFMRRNSSSDKNEKAARPSTMSREDRFQQLMESCQHEVLRQIIGPFGLTPAMFDDKDGGNVTTQHNAEMGIFAKESEEFNRTDYDYSKIKVQIRDKNFDEGRLNSKEFVDRYTGQKEPSRRINSDGKQMMNAELDHTIPLKEIHKQGGWMEDKKGRTDLSSVEENLNYTTHQTNRSKNAKPPEEALSEEKGFDKERIEPIVDVAKTAIEKELPSGIDRLKYQGKEIGIEGVKDGGKNAIRRALGVLLFEFVNGSFIEMKMLLKERSSEQNLIDRLIESLKSVMNRVINKLKDALEAAIQGGVQGFISNLLTFLINNLITTSKKIVTIIRQSMQSLWEAIKLMVNPPEGMSALEITRQVVKLIAAVVTTAIGLLLEESVKGFILSIPVLAPIADMLATALTAIMTGIAGALVVWGIDSLFDWLCSTGTELLVAQEANAEAQKEVVERLESWLAHQYASSRLYDDCMAEYQMIEERFLLSSAQIEAAGVEAEASIQNHTSMIETVESQVERTKRIEDVIKSLQAKDDN